MLKKEGTLWLNIGDTYSANRSYQVADNKSKDVGNHMSMSVPSGMQSKCLCMIPERLAWSLIQNGWILRNKIPWIKPNHMPSSAKDRFATKWEYVFYFVKSQRNYFDLDSIREPHKEKTFTTIGTIRKSLGTDSLGKIKSHNFATSMKERKLNPAGVNPGDIWVIPTAQCPVKGIHFATFPEELCRKAIIPGCPEGGIVLDPFAGIGTTGYVARKLGRKFIMIDIKQEYCDKAENKRLAQGVL